MIGIILALQVNTWNENRKSEKRELLFLTELKLVVQGDLNRMMRLDSAVAGRVSRSEEAIKHFYQAKNIQEILMIDSLFSFAHDKLPIDKRVLNEMLTTGSFYTLKNKDLQEKINNYYASSDFYSYQITEINEMTGGLRNNPDLNPYNFLLDKNRSLYANAHKIDTSWIGNVNSPTFLALHRFFRLRKDFLTGKGRRYCKGS